MLVRRFRIGALTLLGLSTLVAARADEKVALDKVPARVTKAAKAKFPNGEIKKVEKEDEDGRTIYEVTLKDGKRHYAVSLEENGSIVKIEKEIGSDEGEAKGKSRKAEADDDDDDDEGEAKGKGKSRKAEADDDDDDEGEAKGKSRKADADDDDDKGKSRTAKADDEDEAKSKSRRAIPSRRRDTD